MIVLKLLNVTNSAIKIMKVLIISIFTLFLTSSSFAQSYGEFGIMAGGAYYIGDLNPEKHFLLTKPAFGAFLRHNFNERFAAKISGTYTSIEGDDLVSKYNIDRELNFKTNLVDISATYEINFFEYFIGSRRHIITPFWYGGIGVIFFQPRTRFSNIKLAEYSTEGVNYKTMTFSIPFGIGLKYSLNDVLGVSLHWGMQKVFTDYMDDVSTKYYLPDNADLEYLIIADPPRTHSDGMQRGNSKDNDWYSIAGITLSRKINYLSNEKCINVYF